MRRIGAASLGPLLKALGLVIIVAEAPNAAEYTSTLPPRRENLVRHRNRQPAAAA